MARFPKSTAILYSTLAAQIQRKTIKVRRVSYQNTAHKLYKLVAFFLTRTVVKFSTLAEISYVRRCGSVICFIGTVAVRIYSIYSIYIKNKRFYPKPHIINNSAFEKINFRNYTHKVRDLPYVRFREGYRQRLVQM